MADDATPPDIDAGTLRDRYRAERDKRLRTEGNDQYVNMVGEFAHYIDDPYTEFEPRDPVTDHVEICVIGGGFGGHAAILAVLRMPAIFACRPSIAQPWLPLAAKPRHDGRPLGPAQTRRQRQAPAHG